MSSLSVADYKNTPREELTDKIARLLKLNYEAINDAQVNTKFNYDEVTQMVYNQIVASEDFSYTNIIKILEEFVYNQSEVNELLAKRTQELDDAKTKLENCKLKSSKEITPLARLKWEQAEYDIKFTEHNIPIMCRLAEIRIFDIYQPDEFACKPRDYEKMLESLDKFVGNPRIITFAKWYANASIKEQNTEYVSKYAEYFESLDDLITLHEISLGIIPIDGLNVGR